MIDALAYAYRDAIRAAGFNYGKAECEIMEDGKPPPRCGNVFVALHDFVARSTNDNTLMEYYDFKVTLTMRVIVPPDRVGDQQIARNLALVPTAQKQGFNAKVEQLRTILHMNWKATVLTGQTPPSANDNIVAWMLGSVCGFCEPARYRGPSAVSPVGADWFAADPDNDDFGIKAEMRFEGARRFQPVTASVGVFDNTPPFVPTNLVATGNVNTISLAWSAPSTGAASYNIYRGTAPNAETLYDTSATNSYTDNAPGTNILRYYKVTAVNAVGESAKSNEASATASLLALSPVLDLNADVASSLFQDSALTTPAVLSSDPVGGIKDQSGNNNHATQATGANRPNLILGAWSNGKNIVRGASSLDRWLTVPSLNLGTSHTMFFVGYELVGAGGSYVPLGDVGSVSFWPNVTGNFCYYEATSVANTVWDAWERPTIYAIRRTGTTVRLYKNGVPLFQNNGNLTPDGAIDFVLSSNPNFILKGILAFDNGANVWPGDFARCLAFPSALSDANMLAVHNVLQAQYPTLVGGQRVVFDGNSRFFGFGVGGQSGYNNLAAQVMTTLNRKNYFNFGCPSITQAALTARLATTSLAFDSAGTIVCGGEAYNSLNGGQTAAQAYADFTAYVAALRAYPAVKKIVAHTCIAALGTSTANFISQRGPYNTLMLANTAGADVVLDVAARPNLADPTNATYFLADRIHLTTAGYADEAGLYTAAGVLAF